MDSLVGVFMLVMGAGIAGIWTIDLVRSPEVDRTLGMLRARDRSNGSLLVPHWIADYATALLLLAGGTGLVFATAPGAWSWLVPIGFGALACTSLNSLGWVLADRSRAGAGGLTTPGGRRARTEDPRILRGGRHESRQGGTSG